MKELIKNIFRGLGIILLIIFAIFWSSILYYIHSLIAFPGAIVIYLFVFHC